MMLETIQEFAREQLRERGELASIRRQHAQLFLAFAEAARPALEGSEQAGMAEPA